MIDPNIWQSEDVSKLNLRQRLLLIGLFSNADDEGKMRGNPAFVRSTVFPYDDVTIKDIEDDLHNIEDIGSIKRYEVDGNQYIIMVNWDKFQRVDKPQKSMIPNMEKNDSKNQSENESKNDSDEFDEGEHSDSRLKEVKGKELKGSKEKYARNVSMTETEYENLLEKMNETDRDSFIERLNLYKGSTGKTYKSDYMTILNWHRKDEANARNDPSPRQISDEELSEYSL